MVQVREALSGSAWLPATLLLLGVVGTVGGGEPWSPIGPVEAATKEDGDASGTVGQQRGTYVRLWEDPLGQGREVSAEPPSTFRGGQGAATRLLFVCMDGEQSRTAAEERRRARYAIHAAAYSAGRVVEQNGSLCLVEVLEEKVEQVDHWLFGCLKNKLLGNHPDMAGPATRHPVRFAAERLEMDESADSTSYATPLIVYVDLDRTGKPTESLIQKLDHVAGHFESVGIRDKETAWIEVLGPRDSASLIRLREELRQPSTAEGERECTVSYRFWSPWATRPEGNAGQDAPCGRSPAKQPTTHEIHRTIVTDDCLARRCVEELALRGVTRPDQILLIVERDSPFTRSWVTQLREELKLLGASPPQLLVRTFPAHLDGDTTGSGNTQNTDIPPADRDRPFGDACLDYLRRMPLDPGLDFDRIRAVGIFGRDPYDKIRILRALQPALPQGLFFTNDLDARYQHPSFLPYTRNLVVVSAYGLEPQVFADGTLGMGISADGLRLEHPPFRDCYQTSVFLATLLALQNRDSRSREIEPPEPRVFEIGTDGARHLGDLNSNRWDNLFLWWICVVALTVICLYAAIRDHEFGEFCEQKPRIVLAVGAWLLGNAGLWILCGVGSCTEDGEPVSVFEGISCWPTEFLRLHAGLLAIAYLTLACRRSRKDRRELTERMGVRTAGWDEPRLLHRFLPWLIPLPKDDPTRRVECAWRRYFVASDDRARLIRTGVASLLIFGVCQLLFLSWDRPLAPTRGGVARVTDVVIISFSVLTMLWLLCFVIDQCVWTTSLVLELGDEDERHPAPATASSKKLATGSKQRSATKDRQEDALRPFRLTRALADSAQSLVPLPFAVILLIALSRNRVFDDWSWPTLLVFVVLICVAVALWSSIRLGRVARDVQQRTAERLRERYIDGLDDERQRGGLERWQARRQDVLECDSPAFAPFWNHPALRAVLIPAGGVGGVQALQLLMQWSYA